MKTLLTLASAAAIAVGLSLSLATPTLAGPHDDAAAAGFIGGVIGFMAGAAAASSAHPHTYVEYGGDSYEDHVRACKHAYRWRYDPYTDLVTDKWGDQYPCDL